MVENLHFGKVIFGYKTAWYVIKGETSLSVIVGSFI